MRTIPNVEKLSGMVRVGDGVRRMRDHSQQRGTARAALAALASALLLLAFASPGLASPPSHLPLPDPIGGFPLSKACGTAVDSKGDIYVSNAGGSKVEIFDPSGVHVTSIPNANGPCGLAVDSEGNLYVSEDATEKVVKYVPSAYPFAGTPTYGAPAVIDASGKAKGIAVDPFDDRLYVAKGDRIDSYESNGSFTTSIGIGQLTDATGVAAYTYEGAGNARYVFAADAATDEVEIFGGQVVTGLTLRQSIDGSDGDAFKVDKTPDNGIGFGTAGASLAADWTNGHFFVYDDEHEVVDEFEASGSYLTQIASSEFDDAEPTGIAAFPQRNEVQRLRVNAIGGTYTLTFEGQTTSPALSYKATASQIKAALESLSTIGAKNVAVAGSYSVPLQSGSYTIAFVGALGNRDVNQIVPNESGLTLPPGFTKGASVTTEAQGSGPGRIYITSGPSSGAKLLAFAPLIAPSRPARPDLSLSLPSANSVAVDPYGNRYIGVGATIAVYPPRSNTLLTTIADPGKPYDLAVDSACNVYALDANANFQEETVSYFTPTTCPPTSDSKFTKSGAVATSGPPFFPVKDSLRSIGINPANDHLYVSQQFIPRTIELDSAKNGSAILNPNWGAGLVGIRDDIDVYGANGNVYVATSNVVYVVNSAGTEILGRITGTGGPKGPFKPGTIHAVDQANGHVVAFEFGRGVAEEYETSGAFVAEFGSFSIEAGTTPSRVAIDSSCALHKPALENAACEAFDSSDGNVYVAFDDPAPSTFDLTAFGPLAYGETPFAETGIASGLGGGNATLNGTVNPRGFEVSECKFEYLADSLYLSNGKTFAGAITKPCAESVGTIGKGTSPVAVHADLTGLEPEGRYRFRLLANNQYGESEGAAALFGPPVLTTKSALPLYDEAILRARIDPSGLVTKYRFEYGTSAGEYNQSTPTAELLPGEVPTDVQAGLNGLAEGTKYHFRVVVENEAKKVLGPDQSFETQERLDVPPCPNTEYRTGLSANLPDCRAYELVTPADTRGMTPEAVNTNSHLFSNWLVAPNGERLSYFVNGTLPDFDGNGILDGYRARRASGPHPSEGWKSELFSPSYLEAAADLGNSSDQEGIASDQEFSLWTVDPLAGTLEAGAYLRTPTGFEPLGRGSLETDLGAISHYVSPGGAHVVFSSKAHLEAVTPPAAANTAAIYDRAAGSSSASVVSLKPDGTSFGAGQNASYLGTTEDGSTVVFKVGGALYVRHDGATVEVAATSNTFAGISDDGERVFYAEGSVSGPAPAATGLRVCDIQAGPCAGPGAHAPTKITEEGALGRFVNVSADGSHVYFTSTESLDDADEGIDGEDNLYVWDSAGEATHFIALLDLQDFAAGGFQGLADNLVRWTDAIGPTGQRALSPTRSTPEGSRLVFQSHANLTAYDAEGNSEVYLYDSEAAPGGQLTCVSCDPSGAPPSGEALLQDIRVGSTAQPSTLIPNIVDNGDAVFFQSDDPLLPEDANSVEDVYEWQAPGTGVCKRAGGCVALISSGQGEHDSFLYSMTPGGHDVFFTSLEKLVGADVSGSPSIYDARRDGGIPDRPEEAACQGDACQGEGSRQPVLPSAASTGSGNGNVTPGHARCPKGKHRVKKRCVSKHPGRKRHHHKAHAGRRSHR